LFGLRSSIDQHIKVYLKFMEEHPEELHLAACGLISRSAHGGGLDRYGCHRDNKAGNYRSKECHGSGRRHVLRKEMRLRSDNSLRPRWAFLVVGRIQGA